MAKSRSVTDGAQQNTCGRRKRTGRSHRKHGGPFTDGTHVIIANIEPLTGWTWGIVVCSCVRSWAYQTPTKYRVRIDGPGPTEERTIRGSLLLRVALDG